MENTGEGSDKNVPNSVNEENSPKNVNTSTKAVQEIVNEIFEAAVLESIGGNAEEENVYVYVKPPPHENMDNDDSNPLACTTLGSEECFHKYPFRFKKNEKGNIMTVRVSVEHTKDFTHHKIVACCFSDTWSLLVVITEWDWVFVFNLMQQHYFRLNDYAYSNTIITPFRVKANYFLLGGKRGYIDLLDLDKSNKYIIRSQIEKCGDILGISSPPRTTKRQHIVLVHTRYDVIIFDVEEFAPTHRLAAPMPSLKFACFFSHLDRFMQCLDTDAVKIMSGRTLKRVRQIYPIKMRDRKMRMEGAAAISADFVLCNDYYGSGGVFNIDCKLLNYSNGLIIAYCFHPDNDLLCFSTLDGYLLLINTCTLELQHICRLHNFVLRKCVFLQQPNEILICGITDNNGQVVILNCLKKDIKLVMQTKNADTLSVSDNGNGFFAICDTTGDLNLWSVREIYNALKSQEECLRLLTLSFRQNKPVLYDPSRHCKTAAQEKRLNEDIRNLLSRDRLVNILREYRWFPYKYRMLIWCALLQLPYNRSEFFQLLKMGVPPLVKQRAKQIRLQNGTLKNALIRIWSCLAHWCPVFAHCKFLPQLIFPFVKLLPRNSLVVFEICVTLLTNHFQLWFEFHPLEPNNYLGLCENILQSECPELCNFYASMHVKPEHYAWPMLSTAFSEVITDGKWLCLWDNILTLPPYFPIFIVVAINILQRRIIMRLPDKPTILAFFHEQNPINVANVMSKANSIMQNCPSTLHPERYMTELQCIPKNVYPKFLNYPREWLAKHEQDIAVVQREKQCLDARIRQLELEEMKLIERLQSGLRREEHARQVKKMEKLYRDSLKREEERLACQRQLLTVYQKELRNRKAEVAAQVQESEQRQRAINMEKDLEILMQSIEYERTRNDADLKMAEEELRHEELELFVQKCLATTGGCSLRTKYYKDLKRLCNERREIKQQVNELTNIKKPKLTAYNSNKTPHLDTIEERIEEIQREFDEILNS